MIGRFCFCLILSLASLAVSTSASAQFHMGRQNISPFRNRHPMLRSGMLPLSRKFVTPDTLNFGVIPLGIDVYYTLDIPSTASVKTYFDAVPKSYNGLEMWVLTDDDQIDGSVEANTTSTVYYTVGVNPYYYQGGDISCPYYFEYYKDYNLTTLYERDPAFLIASPLPVDTTGPMIMQLLHGRTESLGMLLTDDTSGHTPVDVMNLDSMTEYFILENAENDSLEVTTAQCWGNVTFVGTVLNRTLPFKLAPGEQVLAAMHFEPSTPDEYIHPQTGQDCHMYYDEFVVATDATLGVKFQSNATASGYKPSRTVRDDQPIVDVIHPDPGTPETAGHGSNYHVEWNMTNVSTVNLDYSYHTESGIPIWQSIAQNYSGTSYDWKLPDATGTVDVRIVPVGQPLYEHIVSLNIDASSSNSVKTNTTPSVQVYPNPVSKKLHVGNVHETVVLLDLLGRTVLQTRPFNGGATLDCSQLPVGSYLLRVGNTVRPISIAR